MHKIIPAIALSTLLSMAGFGAVQAAEQDVTGAQDRSVQADRTLKRQKLQTTDNVRKATDNVRRKSMGRVY